MIRTKYLLTCSDGVERVTGADLSTAEIRWMADFSPDLNFALALRQAKADAGSISGAKVREVSE